MVLRESLLAMGLSYDIQGVPNLGSWLKNTSYKATFIRDMLAKYPGKPLVYIDVDALVLAQPVMLATLDCDVAAAKFGGHELLSGTVYFGGTPITSAIVARWIELCDQYPDNFPGGLLPHFPRGSAAWDQRMLDAAIRQTPAARFVELPAEYTYIVGLSQRKYPDAQPIILHTRGRMRHEKAVNGH